MDHPEYLLRYGLLGDFGRFRAVRPLALDRGDRAVVRSHRGLEVAEVIGPAQPGHAHYLPNTSVGSLLRSADPDDDRAAAGLAVRAGALVERAARLAAELELPLEPLDAEILLDGRYAALHLLRGGEGDLRPFVSTLAREFDVQLELVDLGSAPEEAAEEDHGCGREGCGSDAGGCGTCGTGGCGTCGSAGPDDVQAHFAALREQMERRTSLL